LDHGARIVKRLDEVVVAEQATKDALIIAESEQSRLRQRAYFSGKSPRTRVATDSIKAQPAQEAMPIDSDLPSRKFRDRIMIV
jgi:hypothetical protein